MENSTPPEDFITNEEGEDFPKVITQDQKQQGFSNIGWKGWLTLIGSTVYMILLGNVYVTGNITPYVASYYNVKTKEAQ
jgi:hypothetical protein